MMVLSNQTPESLAVSRTAQVHQAKARAVEKVASPKPPDQMQLQRATKVVLVGMARTGPFASTTIFLGATKRHLVELVLKDVTFVSVQVASRPIPLRKPMVRTCPKGQSDYVMEPKEMISPMQLCWKYFVGQLVSVLH